MRESERGGFEMKKYETPEMEVILFGTANVVTDSMLEDAGKDPVDGDEW